MEELLAGLSAARVDALIASALAGEADAAELFVLRRWLGEHGIDLSSTDLPGGVCLLPPMPGVDITSAWTRVLNQLDQPSRGDGRATQDQSVRPVLRDRKVLGRLPLRQIVGAVLDRFAGSAMAALFNRKITTLTVAEMEQLRDLVEPTEPEDK